MRPVPLLLLPTKQSTVSKTETESAQEEIAAKKSDVQAKDTEVVASEGSHQLPSEISPDKKENDQPPASTASDTAANDADVEDQSEIPVVACEAAKTPEPAEAPKKSAEEKASEVLNGTAEDKVAEKMQPPEVCKEADPMVNGTAAITPATPVHRTPTACQPSPRIQASSQTGKAGGEPNPICSLHGQSTKDPDGATELDEATAGP